MWTHRIPGSSSLSSCGGGVPAVIRWSLLVLLALPMCTAVLPFEKWECGSDDGYSKNYSHTTIMKSCPHFAAEINHCCVIHDECYGRKKGQHFCDRQFDDCNQKVVEDERAGPCRKEVDAWRDMLVLSGWFAYHFSPSNYTEPHESELPQLCRPEKTMGVFFDYLYLSCPTIKKPISSCCDQLILCPDLPLGRNRTECANRAMRCLAGARAEEHKGFNGGHCDRALDRTRKYLALDYIMEDSRVGGHRHPKELRAPEIFANSNQAFILLLCLSLMCGAGLLLVTYKYYRLRTENKTRKYSAITLSTA